MKYWSDIVKATLYKLFVEEDDEDANEYTNKMPIIANECLSMIANDIKPCVRKLVIVRSAMRGEELSAYVPDSPSEREIVFCISDYENYKAGTMWYFFDGKKKKITAFEMPDDFLCFADSSDTLLTPWGDLQFHPKIVYASWNSIILPELGTYTIMYNAKYGEVPSNIGYDNEDPWFTLNLTKSYTGKEYAKALDPEADVENETNDIVFNGIQSQVLECLPSYIAATLLEQDDLQRAMILRNEFESMAQRLEDRVLYENEKFVSPGGWY